MFSSTATQRATRSQTRQSSVEDSGLPAKETQKETSQQNAPPKPTQELGKRLSKLLMTPLTEGKKRLQAQKRY
jgi:hypothetical protein